AEAREQARTLSATLWAAREGAAYGVEVALGAARAELRRSTGVDLDYLEITDADLAPLPAAPPPGTEGRVLIAARVGGTRLIDNLPITFGSAPAARTTTHPADGDS
ncbi:MAG TPA: pantoate--beta-alanine ligase, partial [Micromonosporaceae bacterium]|nr:pantoate--beta-alanine ligase [Micromonosporaceae bacterium]